MSEIDLAKEQIIKTGKRLYEAGLAVAKSGNLSIKIDPKTILITATSTALGQLSPEDIVSVELDSLKCSDRNKPSSELPLHSLIYKNSAACVVLHAHPPLINGYFAVNDNLEAMTFETRFYLGNVPVIKQDTPTVTNPAPVIEALKNSNIVVLKNHGVVSIADNFKDALALVEALEEAIKSAVVARLFSKGNLSNAEEVIKERLSSDKVYPMFSKEHIQAIVDLVNDDDFIAQKGKELDLTVNLAIKLNETNQAYKFNFDKGKIIRLDCDADAPFVISAPAAVWEQVFLGKLDSFVAVTQGKMKLEGQLGQLSKWYVPFSRLFEIFKQVKFK
ncbi:MAG: hypothetical protein C4533_00555 [Candidatus Omnitrophota bacterium]|jgi:L-fuculose-phosphate aldolase|nr:MAG: hypothetical protein C4533_00555 [Candidatus Omnitrophota bacterium]